MRSTGLCKNQTATASTNTHPAMGSIGVTPSVTPQNTPATVPAQTGRAGTDAGTWGNSMCGRVRSGFTKQVR